MNTPLPSNLADRVARLEERYEIVAQHPSITANDGTAATLSHAIQDQDELTQRIHALRDDVRALCDQNNTLRDQIRAAVARCDALQSNMPDLTDDVHELAQEIDRLRRDHLARVWAPTWITAAAVVAVAVAVVRHTL